MMWLIAVQVFLNLGHDVWTIWIYYVTSMWIDIIGRRKNEVYFVREKLMYSGTKIFEIAMTYLEI